MNVQIVRTQNGFIVRPIPERHEYAPAEDCWVFNTYRDMADKLSEILDSNRIDFK